MEENKNIVAAPAAEAKPEGEANKGLRGGVHQTREPHGSLSAGRPGDRKFGDRKGRPGERRGGRGGFRREENEYDERVVNINRISKTVTGGKHMRFSALIVLGDHKGKYGFAIAKSGEVPDAIKKAQSQAKKHMYTVKLAKGDTIAHEVEGKFGATKVVLKPAKPGTGVVAGGPVRAILELCGVKNVVSKVYGSRAPINIIRATHAGLVSMKDYEKTMVLRGLKKAEDFKAKKAEAPKSAPKGDK